MKHVLGVFLLLLAIISQAQVITVTGVVTDAFDGQPIPGANVVIQGTTVGTVTSFEGTYSMKVEKNGFLVFSCIGMETKIVQVKEPTINVILERKTSYRDEVVIVGYGVQKKESVVGSIVQASGEELMQSGGVSTVGQALTGKLPGVSTISSTGRPGDESPQIFIRGKSTWSGDGQPLVLVDGIERSMTDVDVGDIENISVLKDASATAVFGVKGANGVILITTKRGTTGKAQLSLSASTTFKTTSKLPDKYDAYNSIMVMNQAIERDVALNEEVWAFYTPVAIADKHRNPANELEAEIYPDVDWEEETLKPFAMDHRINLSVRGGSEFAKYFGALTYQHVGDIFDGEHYSDDRGYTVDFSYDRFNYRSNVDFDITPSTRVSVNLSGYYGIQGGNESDNQHLYNSIYELAPNLYAPVYSDGTYGRDPIGQWDLKNPAMIFASKGATQSHRIQVNSDFAINQKLDFLTKGLSFKASLAFDNNFQGTAGVKEDNPGGKENVIYKLYNQDGTYYFVSPSGTNQFDYVISPWTYSSLNIDEWATSRKLFYQFALNYVRTFADNHNVTALALMSREEYAQGDGYPTYREDWVGRLTYNYDSKYFIDVNGAYNGSEKFGDGYKFQLFPSVALGWMVSNEPFMENMEWLTRFKFKGSYGLVGDDSAGDRWSYVSQWSQGGSSIQNNSNIWGSRSPYTFYSEAVIGNPDLRWETATKGNFGFEMGIFDNKLTFDFDYFTENREDIIIVGDERSMPSFYGFKPSDANVGETKVNGYEITAKFQHNFRPEFRVFADFSFTQAKDEIIYKEEPQLREAYSKEEGYSIGQNKVTVRGDLMESWDDVYASTPQESSQESRHPGYYDEIDFNSDGIVNTDDAAPYGYSNRPENTWNTTLGFDYKAFSFMCQFYGAFNATKNYQDRTFVAETSLFFEFKEDYWSVDNPDGSEVLPNFSGTSGGTDSYRNWYDASYVRLKNVELAYKFKAKKGKTNYRVYMSGSDLYFWSDLPDDRLANTGGSDSYRGNYPTFRRVNFGININF